MDRHYKLDADLWLTLVYGQVLVVGCLLLLYEGVFGFVFSMTLVYEDVFGVGCWLLLVCYEQQFGVGGSQMLIYEPDFGYCWPNCGSMVSDAVGYCKERI